MLVKIILNLFSFNNYSESHENKNSNLFEFTTFEFIFVQLLTRDRIFKISYLFFKSIRVPVKIIVFTHALI